MPGLLNHSPADVVRWLLIALGLGTDPANGQDWPVFAAGEPGSPDSTVTLYDTTSRQHGRVMVSGERQEHHGIQVRVRSATQPVGYAKARALAVALDQSVYQETVTVDGHDYFVHCIDRTSDVLALGKETPTSKRTIFTINALVAVREM